MHVEEVTDWSFETDHPVAIDKPTITKVLLGLYRMDGQGRSSKTPASDSKQMKIFSKEEAALLAPCSRKVCLDRPPTSWLASASPLCLNQAKSLLKVVSMCSMDRST